VLNVTHDLSWGTARNSSSASRTEHAAKLGLDKTAAGIEVLGAAQTLSASDG
jgi:hypothetical protein